VAEQVIYVAANDGRLYALDRRTGARRWQFATDGATLDQKKEGYDRRSIQSAPSIVAGVVMFGSRDGTIYGVDAATGHDRWRASYAPSWTSGSPTIRGDTAFVTTSDAKVVAALDARTVESCGGLQSARESFPPVRLVDDAALVGTDGGQLVSLDASTGRIQWRFEAEIHFKGAPGCVMGCSTSGRMADGYLPSQRESDLSGTRGILGSDLHEGLGPRRRGHS